MNCEVQVSKFDRNASNTKGTKKYCKICCGSAPGVMRMHTKY